MLVTYGIPETALKDEEARKKAKAVLKKAPNDQWCQRILIETANLGKTTNPSMAEQQQALIAQNPKEALKHFVLTGRFLIAKTLLHLFPCEEVNAMLLSIAQEEHNLTTYAFLWTLLKEKETPKRHLLLAKIAKESFKYEGVKPMNGVEAICFFHTQRAAELTSKT